MSSRRPNDDDNALLMDWLLLSPIYPSISTQSIPRCDFTCLHIMLQMICDNGTHNLRRSVHTHTRRAKYSKIVRVLSVELITLYLYFSCAVTQKRCGQLKLIWSRVMSFHVISVMIYQTAWYCVSVVAHVCDKHVLFARVRLK